MLNGDIRFDVTEDVNVKLYIPSACQNQILSDANLCQKALFMIIFICHIIVLFSKTISRARLFFNP